MTDTNDNSNKEYVEKLRAVKSFSYSEFEKTLVFISSGAFIISFAFIDNLLEDGLAYSIQSHRLFFAWTCFASVIILSLICHFISILGVHWAENNIDLEKEKFNKRRRKFNYTIRAINILNIVGIKIGAYQLIYFVYINS